MDTDKNKQKHPQMPQIFADTNCVKKSAFIREICG